MSKSAIYRPKLMVRTAEIGLSFYNRRRDLGRVLHKDALPAEGRAVEVLLGIEERLEDARLSGHGSYRVSRHVFVMTALLAEMGFAEDAAMRESARAGEHLRLVVND